MSLLTYFHLLPLLIFALIWICIAAFLRLKKKMSVVYLFFFTIFYVYFFKVLDYTLFQFQSLLLLKYFVPRLLLNGIAPEKSVNLIPLITLTSEDLKTSLLNILLFIPFGFGMPFITNFRLKKVLVIGVLFSVGIELLQFLTGVMAHRTFRIADINDVLCNTLGVAIGYILFRIFIRIYRGVFRHSQVSMNPLLRYIADRPQMSAAAMGDSSS